MRLSEAIRIGSACGEQCRGNYFQDGACCAMGAAAFAINPEAPTMLPSEVRDLLYRTWPELHTFIVKPDGHGNSETLFGKIVLLNDHEEWTREQIAAWLESQGL